MRVGVVASGYGSNFEALVNALHLPDSPAIVAVLVCNVAGARVLQAACDAHVTAVTLAHTAWPTRQAFDMELARVLEGHRIHLVCLAGYMRLLTPAFLQRFPQRVINVHPALLPAFPGLHAVRQALAYGVKVTGCTVHFVDEGVDSGPIIAQAAVPVLPEDDEVTLAARIRVEEHRLYAETVKAMAYRFNTG